jgi:hypothetical protein
MPNVFTLLYSLKLRSSVLHKQDRWFVFINNYGLFYNAEGWQCCIEIDGCFIFDSLTLIFSIVILFRHYKYQTLHILHKLLSPEECWNVGISRAGYIEPCGQGQTSNFSCAEPNVNELSSLFHFVCISFGT